MSKFQPLLTTAFYLNHLSSFWGTLYKDGSYSLWKFKLLQLYRSDLAYRGNEHFKKRKVILMLLFYSCIGLLVSCIFATVCPAAEYVEILVTKETRGRINLRALPTTESAILKKLGNLEPYVLIRSEGGWSSIQVSEDMQGWIKKTLHHAPHKMMILDSQLGQESPNSIPLPYLLCFAGGLLLGGGIYWGFNSHLSSIMEKYTKEREARLQAQSREEGRQAAMNDITIKTQPFAHVVDGWVWKEVRVGYAQQIYLKNIGQIGGETRHISYEARKVDTEKIKQFLDEVQETIREIRKLGEGVCGFGIVSVAEEIVGIAVDKLGR